MTSAGLVDPAASVRAQRPRLAVVTWSLIALCVAIWAAQELLPGFTETVALSPADGRDQPWRFLTSGFAHARGLLQVALDMVALHTLGTRLEFLLGRGRFALLYLAGALGGAAAGVLLAPDLQSPEASVGASGAVIAVLGVALVLHREPARALLGPAVLVLAAAGLPMLRPGLAGWREALGGLVSGLVLGLLVRWDAARRTAGRAGVLAPGLAAAVALMAAAVALRYLLG